MAIVTRVADFGQLGLALDPQPTLLKPGQWDTLTNIDVESGDVRSAWGDSPLAQNSPISPKYTFVFEGLDQTWLVVSDGASVYVYDNAVWTKISAGTVTVPDSTWDEMETGANTAWDDETALWDDFGTDPSEATVSGRTQFTVFLGTLIVCSPGAAPSYWPDTGANLQVLPGWDLNWRANEIHSYGNFLVALSFDDNVIAGAKFRVAWSDAAAEGEVPQTWTAALENLAGSVQLRDTEGYITTAELFGDDLVIYKNDSIVRMSVVQGETIMSFETVVIDHGCDSFDGVAVLNGMHYFADRGDIRVFNGQQTKSVALSRIIEAIQAAISNEYRDKTIIVAYPEREEIWVGGVPAGEDTVDAVLIYNTAYSTWTQKSYPDTISLTVGPFTTAPISSAWDDVVGTWEAYGDNWQFSVFDPSEDGVIFGREGEDNLIYRADKSNTDADGNPKRCIAQRTGFVISDLERNVTLKAVYPEMEGPGPVKIQIGGQWHSGDTVRWTSPQIFTPGVDQKINCRITGTPTALRISSQADTWWRLGAVSFAGVEASAR